MAWFCLQRDKKGFSSLSLGWSGLWNIGKMIDKKSIYIPQKGNDDYFIPCAWNEIWDYETRPEYHANHIYKNGMEVGTKRKTIRVGSDQCNR